MIGIVIVNVIVAATVTPALGAAYALVCEVGVANVTQAPAAEAAATESAPTSSPDASRRLLATKLVYDAGAGTAGGAAAILMTTLFAMIGEARSRSMTYACRSRS